LQTRLKETGADVVLTEFPDAHYADAHYA